MRRTHHYPWMKNAPAALVTPTVSLHEMSPFLICNFFFGLPPPYALLFFFFHKPFTISVCLFFVASNGTALLNVLWSFRNPHPSARNMTGMIEYICNCKSVVIITITNIIVMKKVRVNGFGVLIRAALDRIQWEIFSSGLQHLEYILASETRHTFCLPLGRLDWRVSIVLKTNTIDGPGPTSRFETLFTNLRAVSWSRF